MVDFRALLIDIDGVLTVSWRPLPGAVDALARLRAAGVGVRLVTNTTSRTRSSIVRALRTGGFDIATDEVMTGVVATAEYLRHHHPGARCLLLNSGDVTDDLEGVTLVDDDPDVVVLGGAGPEFGYGAINRVFGHVQRGASFVAMHNSLRWRTSEGLVLDSGAFLLGIERAADREAVVVGKPSGEFFTSALHSLEVEPGAALMVGDDVESDVLAAQRLGITGVLVRTGKYTPETTEAASGVPDHVLDSFADVPDLLGV
ncbi:TIGR01458 family HAD-type hydrolase [Saccharopolyspora erythraea]|uniref:TIGR01458 family HAD-type hydrolase n=1 Tax=Saccharopolyspora erythraea TaxID=1836 RepID=UPI001BABA531|nr:TIGR01458 family HAD-type hydrolase [Saccharopolyspora erythraea]QUH00669.1 TIGR01458 family HAD-type hydrolase [Saccharopolyspora erythraea]